jgi:regulatory protein
MQKKQYTTVNDAWAKIQKYCAYQERCHREVKEKLYSLGLATNDVEGLTAQLIEHNYLNEERFAKAYAGGKFRTKKWGRLKILRELKTRDISDYCIKQAMKEIDDVLYYEQLKTILYKKWDELKKETNMYIRKNKTSTYAIAKGYETDLVWDLVRELT